MRSLIDALAASWVERIALAVLLLLDLSLPGIHGSDLIRRLRSLQQRQQAASASDHPND